MRIYCESEGQFEFSVYSLDYAWTNGFLLVVGLKLPTNVIDKCECAGITSDSGGELGEKVGE